MEGKPVAEKRKRLSAPLLRTKGFDSSSLDSTFGRKAEAKIRRVELPHKMPESRYFGRNVVLSCDLVKDLRSHRVFSPSSELYKEMSNQKLGFGFDDSENDSKPAKSEDVSCGDRSILGQTGKFDSGFLNSETLDVLDEKCARKTPNPEAKAFAGARISENCGNGMGIGKPLNGNAQDEGCVNGDKNIESDSKTKPFLKPCFRRKVFKTPGSISYRRLLPYLMDMSKNDSGDGGHDQDPKLDKVFEEKKPQATQASQGEEASKDGVEENRISVECQDSHSDTTVQGCAIESANSDELKLTSFENVSLSPSTAGADDCWSVPLVNDIENSKDQKSATLNFYVPNAVKDLQTGKDDLVCTSSDASKPMVYVGTTENDDLFTFNGQDGDTGNTEARKDHDAGGQKSNQMNDQREGDDGGALNQADNLNEESNQMTPPDADIFGKLETEGNEVERADSVIQNSDHFLRKLPSGINHGNACFVYNTRHDSNSKCRMVLKPRSQMKLFRSPGSLSYRRMLPFLMNIAKENSDTSGNGHCANPQKDLEHPSLLATDIPEIPSDKSNDFWFEENQKDYYASQMAVQTFVKDSSKDKETLVSSEHGSEFQTSFISQEEEPLQFKEAVSTITGELETSPGSSSSVQAVQDTGRPVASLCFSNCEASSREELDVLNSNQSSVETDRDLSRSAMKSSDGVESVEEDKLFCASPQTGLTPVSLVTPASGPKKGILKRNPRGCRGLCTCLNCTSFRLHAERGFEFSKNQMEEAEEVVVDLIKELSYLRNILEKSADAAGSCFVNVNQMKEACRKASEAEELAKDRLNQMNYDLGVHCRITCLEPPRVRFAGRVEEKIILKSGSPSKQVLKHEKENGQRELKTK